MKTNQKFYVVWEGHQKGIFDSWNACQTAIHGFKNARYKSFESLEEAKIAFKQEPPQFANFQKAKSDKPLKTSPKPSAQSIIWDSISVDAACSGNPGNLEYRGVRTQDGHELFKQGVFQQGTNNIGEFLAIVHALAFLQKQGLPQLPIYTDSQTALKWVRSKQVKTTLVRTSKNQILFDLMDRAINWLNANQYANPILKWETEKWGEIPADFGRK